MSTLRVTNLQDLNSGLSVAVTELRQGKKIAVLGDSLTTHNNLMGDAWPNKLEEAIYGSGKTADIINLAVNANTAFRMNTQNYYGTKSVLEVLEEYKPSLIISALGFNDTVTKVDARSLSQVQEDFLTLYLDIKTTLPDVTLVHAHMVPYNQERTEGVSLYNKDTLPSLWNKNSGDLLEGYHSSEHKNLTLSSGTQSAISDWISLRSYINNLTTVDSFFDINYFKIARLGLTGPDLLHPSYLGSVIQSAYVLKGLKQNSVDFPFFNELSEKQYPVWEDPDILFDDLLTWDVVEEDYDFSYKYSQNIVQMRQSVEIRPDVWMYPTKASFSISGEVIEPDQPFSWRIFGAAPKVGAFLSVDGGAWLEAGSTDNHGNSFAITIGRESGVSDYHYRFDEEVFGPYTVEFKT